MLYYNFKHRLSNNNFFMVSEIIMYIHNCTFHSFIHLFEIGSCYGTQSGLRFMGLLFQLPRCWDFGSVPAHLAHDSTFSSLLFLLFNFSLYVIFLLSFCLSMTTLQQSLVKPSFLRGMSGSQVHGKLQYLFACFGTRLSYW
jgi:hypothetical protein